MWYKTKVVSDEVNAARELVVHMINPGLEHWKAWGIFTGHIKIKDTKGIIIRKHKVLKAVMFCDLNYATEKETRKSVIGLVASLGGTLLTRLSKTQTIVALSSTETEYAALSAC